MKTKILLQFSKSISVLFVLLLFTVFLNGCDEDDNPVMPSGLYTLLQITNASPNSPDFDLYVNNIIVDTNLSYLSSTHYKPYPVDTGCRITVYEPGGAIPVIDTITYLQNSKTYSCYFYDSLHKIKPLIIMDTIVDVPYELASIRLVDLSPNSQTLDVGGVGKAEPWFSSYSFLQVSPFRFITKGTYTVYANLAGTSTTVTTIPGADLQSGIYTILIRGFEGSSGSEALGLTIIKEYFQP